jgi:hypothetical protein
MTKEESLLSSLDDKHEINEKYTKITKYYAGGYTTQGIKL